MIKNIIRYYIFTYFISFLHIFIGILNKEFFILKIYVFLLPISSLFLFFYLFFSIRYYIFYYFVKLLIFVILFFYLYNNDDIKTILSKKIFIANFICSYFITLFFKVLFISKK